MATKVLSPAECFHYLLDVPKKDLQYLFTCIDVQGFVSIFDLHHLVSYGIPIYQAFADHFKSAMSEVTKKCNRMEITNDDFFIVIEKMTSPEGMFYLKEEPRSVQIQKAYASLKLAFKKAFHLN